MANKDDEVYVDGDYVFFRGLKIAKIVDQYRSVTEIEQFKSLFNGGIDSDRLEDARQEGRDEVYRDAEYRDELYHECYDEAYDEGKEDGRLIGYDEGYDEGYGEGYGEGYDKGCGVGREEANRNG